MHFWSPRRRAATAPVARALLAALALALPFAAGATQSEAPAAGDASARQIVGDWLVGLQFRDPALRSFGSLLVHDDPALYAADGTPYFRVVPYQASLAVLCLLESGREDRLEVAEGWIRWYLSHMRTDPPRGVVRDHWYRADGSGETTCPLPGHSQSCEWEDASDSNAALFLLVVAAYWRAGGSEIGTDTPGLRAGLRRAAQLILELQDASGLTIARADYPIRFLMDNSETHAGLEAMAWIEAERFGNEAEARRYREAASRIRAGIETRLRAGGALYRPADDGHTAQQAQLERWYPDTAAQLWPQLFGVEPADSEVSRAALASVNESWAWTRGFADPRGFPWSSIAYTHVLAGDPERARRHSELVLREKLDAESGRRFAWPFAVDDAGWLLRTLTVLESNSNRAAGEL